MSSRILTVSGLIVVAATCAYFAFTSARTSVTTTPSLSTNLPKSWSTNVFIKQFNEKGSLQSSVKATQVTSINNTDKTTEHNTWENPRIQTVDSAGLTWDITAKRGVSYGQDKIVLYKNVIMHRLVNKKYPSKPDTVVTTEQATLYPKKSIGKTDKFAKIVQPQQTITGQGMIINFKTSKAKIISHSQAVFHNIGD